MVPNKNKFESIQKMKSDIVVALRDKTPAKVSLAGKTIWKATPKGGTVKVTVHALSDVALTKQALSVLKNSGQIKNFGVLKEGSGNAPTEFIAR